MKVQRAVIGKNQYTWLVIGEDYLPVKPIHEFIKYLGNIEKSPNTLRAYANHLKLYWDFLEHTNKRWTEIKLDDLAKFVQWLRIKEPSKIIYLTQDAHKRTETTVNAILAALSQFYDFHNQTGNTNIQLTRATTSRYRQYKPFLHHISKYKQGKKRLIKLKEPKLVPKTLKQEEIKKVIASCNNLRDRFLINLLYETGMRIGQALGLKHEDIKSWDNEIHIYYRKNNINQALSKSRKMNVVCVSPTLMDLYAKYVIEMSEKGECNYVFASLQDVEKPLTYSAIRALFKRLSKKSGIKVMPHMLRHTHATELIRYGLDSAYVQKRLGHSSVQTTLNIYAHLDKNDLKKVFLDYQKGRNKNETE